MYIAVMRGASFSSPAGDCSPTSRLPSPQHPSGWGKTSGNKTTLRKPDSIACSCHLGMGWEGVATTDTLLPLWPVPTILTTLRNSNSSRRPQHSTFLSTSLSLFIPFLPYLVVPQPASLGADGQGTRLVNNAVCSALFFLIHSLLSVGSLNFMGNGKWGVNHLPPFSLFFAKPFSSSEHTPVCHNTRKTTQRMHFTSLDTVAIWIIQNGVETKQSETTSSPTQCPSVFSFLFTPNRETDGEKFPVKEINGAQMSIQQIKFHAYIENH